MTTIDEVARRLDQVELRLRALEGGPERVSPPPVGPERVASPAAGPERVAPAWPPPHWPPPRERPQWPQAAPPAAGGPPTTAAGMSHGRPGSSDQRMALEDWFGGRVLAWLGGIAVLAGVAFLLVLAVRRGWLGEEERTALGALTSLLALAWGVITQERGGRTDAARAASAAGVAGLFATLVTASRLYELVAAVPALAGTVAVGVTATALAIRWRSEGIGALGLLGALAAPLLVGAPLDDTTLALLWIVAASAAVVVVAQRWDWLAAASFGLTTPQWAGWLIDAGRSDAAVVVMLSAYGALHLATLAGLERGGSASPWSPPIAIMNALTLGVAGWAALGADWWLAALGAVHVLAGIAALTTGRIGRGFAGLLVGLGILALDVAFALHFEGLVLVAGWAAAAVAWTAAQRAVGPAAASAAVAHFALALGHVLLFEAPPEALSAGLPDAAAGLGGVAIAAAAAAVAAGVNASGRAAWGTLAVTLALYGASVAIVSAFEPRAQEGQLALSAFWALTGIGALIAGLAREAPALRAGAFVLVGIAAGKVFLVDLASLTSLYRVGSFMAFGVLALAGAYAWQRIRPGRAD